MSFAVPTKPVDSASDRLGAIRDVKCTVASLQAPVAVLNLTRSGVLVEAAEPLRVGSQHIGVFAIDKQRLEFQLRVTHLQSSPGASRHAGHRIGLAFHLRSGRDYESLDRLMAFADGGAQVIAGPWAKTAATDAPRRGRAA